jgi:hypothetical protein
MTRRTILIFTLSILVLLGLVAGLFAGSIAQALEMPQRTQMMANTPRMQPTRGKTNTPVTTPHATMPANNNQPNQQMMLATDTFQRPNQAFWGAASDGHQWGGDAKTNQSFSITSLKGQIAAGQGHLDTVIGLPTDNVDVTISGSVNQFGNNVNLGTVLRWTDPNNWYKAFIDGNHLGILKSVKGKTSIIKQIDVQTNAGTAQTLRFQSLGTMLFAKVWPSGTTEPQKWMIIVDDQTFTTGQFGIRVLEQPATVITIMSFNATTASIGNNM